MHTVLAYKLQVVQFCLPYGCPKAILISAYLKAPILIGQFNVQLLKMTFDKTKAMRNAERFLSQGKIGSAIGEFRQVVSHDPRDFSTMNMLGDLYAKNSETRPAADCYKAVAEHYAKQGFAQKAIAVYNKITRIQPNTIEVTACLAELYKEKGALKDARTQYEQLAEHFRRSGRKIEALETLKQIAELDPRNAEPFVSVAEGYVAENCKDEAAESFAEAGRRFAKLSEFDKSFTAYERSLDLVDGSPQTFGGYIEAAFVSGKGVQAVSRLEKCHQDKPYDREVHSLLVDCYVCAGELEKAEKSLIKLIEQEPACYPKLLELNRMYMAVSDVPSAARVLSMAAEHMLMAGQAEELSTLVSAIIDEEPEQLDALRMMVRCMSWLKDEARFRESLNAMAKAARNRDSVDDERFALSQIVMIAPHESEYADRLKEINELHGFEQDNVSDSLFDKRFVDKKTQNGSNGAAIDFAFEANADAISDQPANGFAFASAAETPVVEASVVGQTAPVDGVGDVIQREIDSIKFYIESGYGEIAEKAITEFRAEHGERPEIGELLALLKGQSQETSVEPPIQEPTNTHQPTPSISGSFDLSDLRTELGFDEAESEDGGDFETHYQTAVAYQEMHLLEDAIKEFQQAVSLVEPNDGTRRFFQCANLLGHCFMQHGKPNLAVRWFTRTLETADISDDEKIGLWYELAAAYEGDGDYENAGRYYELVYTENINFRDVSQRVNSMAVSG